MSNPFVMHCFVLEIILVDKFDNGESDTFALFCKNNVIFPPISEPPVKTLLIMLKDQERKKIQPGRELNLVRGALTI